jgi:hypothetical protein
MWGVEDRLKALEKVFDREVQVKLKNKAVKQPPLSTPASTE